MWSAIAQIGGSLLGGALGAKGAESAADTQAQAAMETARSNERIFDKQVDLQSPFRSTGLAANNRLAMLLGLTQVETPEQIRKRLVDQYTSTQQVAGSSPSKKQRLINSLDPFNIFGKSSDDIESNVTDPLNLRGSYNVDPTSITSLDENELQRAIQATIAQQQSDVSNSQYGSLLRDFGAQDFEADPSYAFRQQQGLRGVESGAAARGGLLSGAALKAIQKYGQDLASQEYGNAYQRFNADKTNKYNMLAGLVNTGQGATNQLTNAAGQLGQNNANAIIGAGNAQAAGQVGQANAWNQAIGQGINNYQSNQLMDLIRNPGNNSYASQSYFTPSGSTSRAVVNY